MPLLLAATAEVRTLLLLWLTAGPPPPRGNRSGLEQGGEAAGAGLLGEQPPSSLRRGEVCSRFAGDLDAVGGGCSSAGCSRSPPSVVIGGGGDGLLVW